MPTQLSLSEAGTGRFTVVTAPNCSWTAVGGSGWVSVIQGDRGTGDGVVLVSASANTGGSRTSTFTIANSPVVVTQAGGDQFPEFLSIVLADLRGNRLWRTSNLAGTGWRAGPLPVNGTLASPWHIAVDTAGRIYVADRDNDRIVRIDDITGANWTTFSGPPGQPLVRPRSVSIDGFGRIYIVDSSAHPLVRIDDMSGANYVSFSGLPAGGGPPDDATSLCDPTGIAFDIQGRIYISDANHYRIVRIDDMTGTNFSAYPATFVACAPPQDLTGRNGVGQFNKPDGIAVDDSGRIYVTDTENDRIVRIDDMTGAGWTTFGTQGNGVNQVNDPHDIKVSHSGEIYIADSGNGRLIRMLDMNGSGWITFGSQPNEFDQTNPNAIPPGLYESIAPEGLALGPPLSPACTFSLSPGNVSVAGSGGSSTFTVSVNSGCAWAALSNQSWLTITGGGTGDGNGVVTYTATSNPAPTPRVAVISIGGSAIYLTQDGVPAAIMSVDKTSLTFAVGTTTPGGPYAYQTGSQTVRLTQTGPGTVGWSATILANPWLSVSPTSGTGSATLTFRVLQVPVGQSGFDFRTVTLTFFGGTTSPITINVTLRMIPSANSTAPQGVFDTPINGATGIAGSVAVTGWAVDDVEVTRVRILRDPVASEAPEQLVFIGNAVMVDGARPDVAATFPTLPRNTSAGWGYLMLTNTLPNLGDGTYKIYAFADDADGHSSLLGTKIITCSNSASTAPFGAIDTPGQGDVVSGTIANFGWVLTKAPTRADAPGGGTVTVFVDGVPVGSPSGWTARPDLTAVFGGSGVNDVTSTLAVFSLDTTVFPNGVHTISWVANATNGLTSGIGSRFFTISNGALLRASPVVADELAGYARRDNVRGRLGFDLEGQYRMFAPGRDGVITIETQALDRIELEVGEGAAGYFRSKNRLDTLPPGSHIDPVSGTFTWQPGPGFSGTYEFVFVTGSSWRIVRVVLAAR